MFEHLLHIVMLLLVSGEDHVKPFTSCLEHLWHEASIDQALELRWSDLAHTEILHNDREGVKAEDLGHRKTISDMILERTLDVRDASQVDYVVAIRCRHLQ